MRFIDVLELKSRTNEVLGYLQTHDIVLMKDGEPVAIIRKFDDVITDNVSKKVISELVKSDKNTATQYAAMLRVWGDPECDIYDEAFKDD